MALTYVNKKREVCLVPFQPMQHVTRVKPCKVRAPETNLGFTKMFRIWAEIVNAIVSFCCDPPHSTLYAISLESRLFNFWSRVSIAIYSIGYHVQCCDTDL